VLIDGYISEDVLDLLTSKAEGALVRILTGRVEPALKVHAEAFNKQYGGLSLRASRAFHDRFVIVDDSLFYHFGASIKDLGGRGFMFSRIEEPMVIESLHEKFSSAWEAAERAIESETS